MALKVILHITERTAWERAVEKGEYRTESLETEGFIHCSTVVQVLRVANNFYKGQQNLALLVIERKKVSSPLKYEPPSHPGDQGLSALDTLDLFPHIYGPLNIDAVLMVVDFPPNADGSFSLPAVVDEIT